MVNLLLLDRTLSHEQAIANGLADRWKLPRAECCYGWSSYRLLNGFSSGTRRTLLKPASRETSCLSMCGGLCDGWFEDVISDVARAWEGLRQLDQRLAASAADIGHQGAAFQPGLHLGHGWQPHRDEQVLKPTCGEAFQSIPHVVVVGRLGDTSPVLEGLDQLGEGSDHTR